jgi:hypothetical protein
VKKRTQNPEGFPSRETLEVDYREGSKELSERESEEHRSRGWALLIFSCIGGRWQSGELFERKRIGDLNRRGGSRDSNRTCRSEAIAEFRHERLVFLTERSREDAKHYVQESLHDERWDLVTWTKYLGTSDLGSRKPQVYSRE